MQALRSQFKHMRAKKPAFDIVRMRRLHLPPESFNLDELALIYLLAEDLEVPPGGMSFICASSILNHLCFLGSDIIGCVCPHVGWPVCRMLFFSIALEPREGAAGPPCTRPLAILLFLSMLQFCL
ncbi:hypothetical protein Taro_056978 [Colocasia esculenta]|uniref:Uncharacterized protein n=1 Tax=Colocasia esculenta TaxID=4460 RepID=A0A843XUU4_COLES|nr:hypothetical protein [Colocasia esculenta]